MIKNFGNKAAKDLWENATCKGLPRQFHRRARFLLQIMASNSNLNDLKIKGTPPNIRLHKLHGNQKEDWSVTIDNQSSCRITFQVKGEEFTDVKIEDYH